MELGGAMNAFSGVWGSDDSVLSCESMSWNNQFIFNNG
jgi:hypothetical protein